MSFLQCRVGQTLRGSYRFAIPAGLVPRLITDVDFFSLGPGLLINSRTHTSVHPHRSDGWRGG